MAGPAKVRSIAISEGEIAVARDTPSESPDGEGLATPILDRDGTEPITPDLKTVFLGGLFLLADVTVCYAAADFVLPVVVAFALMLVLQPAMRGLEDLHVPRAAAALLLLALVFGAIAGIITVLAGPASEWA